MYRDNLSSLPDIGENATLNTIFKDAKETFKKLTQQPRPYRATLFYTPRSAFDVASKFPLVEGSVIIYGLNPQGALFLSHSQICIHKTVVRYSQVGHTSKSDLSGWLTIIRSISVCAVSEILVGSFMIHFIPYDLKIRRSRLPK